MEKFLEYIPFIVTILYFALIAYSLSDGEFRNKFIESHKEKSQYSWTRIMGTFITLSAIIIMFIQVLSKQDISLMLITSLLGIAFSAKVIQKKNEKGEKSVFITKNKDDNDESGDEQ